MPSTRHVVPSRPHAAGEDAGERRLNGLQRSGREYRNLSGVQWHIDRTNSVSIPVRDGVRLRADIYLPTARGPATRTAESGGAPPAHPGLSVPALVSFSCYPRQAQDLGAPLGFIEAGTSDFFVPRGYAHVIVNARGTSGSEGVFALGDQQEHRDVYDVIEWVASQPWCDGHVGGMGISYFAIAQLSAAALRPPHLDAIFPFAALADLYDAVWHNGVFNSGFFSAWLGAVGVASAVSDDAWHGARADLARRVLTTASVHRLVAHVNGQTALTVLKGVVRAHYAEEPFGRLWQEAAVEHPTHDGWWNDRDIRDALAAVDIPVYLGCQWDNVPMHLPGTFDVFDALRANPRVRLTLAAQDVLAWPWESMHVEALAWHDHWLKQRDTGIMDGPAVRYVVPGTTEWRTSASWPPPESRHVRLALRADGALGLDEGTPGSREYLYLAPHSGRPRNANPPVLPDRLEWHTDPTANPYDIVGEIELELEAEISALDTAWIVTLCDVDAEGTVVDISAGWLRAQLRSVDEVRSRPGRPVLPCTEPVAVPVGEPARYRIPIVPNARHMAAGHRLRLTIASSDEQRGGPSLLGFTHTPVGQSSVNRVLSGSRLLLPVVDSSGGTL